MKTGIPQFGPLLKESYVHGSEFREFLLTKCIYKYLIIINKN